MSCLEATREQCCLLKLIQNPVHFIVLYNLSTRALGIKFGQHSIFLSRKMRQLIMPWELWYTQWSPRVLSGSQVHLSAPVLGASWSGGGGWEQRAVWTDEVQVHYLCWTFPTCGAQVQSPDAQWLIVWTPGQSQGKYETWSSDIVTL